jgi:hypothetical protein
MKEGAGVVESASTLSHTADGKGAMGRPARRGPRLATAGELLNDIEER